MFEIKLSVIYIIFKSHAFFEPPYLSMTLIDFEPLGGAVTYIDDDLHDYMRMYVLKTSHQLSVNLFTLNGCIRLEMYDMFACDLTFGCLQSDAHHNR